MTGTLAIFDFDGTLADTYPVFAESLDALAVAHGFRRVAPDKQQRLRGLSAADMLRELRLPLWKVPADFRGIMQRRVHDARLFPGIADALLALMRLHVAVAVATSNSLDNVQAVLGDALVARLAAVECGAALFGKSQRLRRIPKTTQAAPANTIYIGDEIRDADAAERVGVAFGAVAWGDTQAYALLRTHPARLFRASADLLDMVAPASNRRNA